ncbi:MAG: hypothetical protein ACLFVU_12080 [Phycisphaerae bacterium]
MRTSKASLALTAALLVLSTTVGTGFAVSQFSLEQDINGDQSYVWAHDSTVRAFQSAGSSLADFYNYKGISGYDFVGESGVLANGDLLGPSYSHLFLVQAGNQLGLFVVHGKGTGGNDYNDLRTASMTLTFDGGFTLCVEDNENGNVNGYGDTYTEDNDSFPPTLQASWQWDGDWTDGAAIQWDADQGEATVQFDSYDAGFIGNWVFLQPGENGGTEAVDLSLATGAPVRLTALATTPASVPLPAAAWPVVGMLAVFAARKWKANRRVQQEVLR